MLIQRNEHKADISNAYANMLIQESADAQHKKLNNAVGSFINKNKSAFKDLKGAMKIVSDIKAHEWDIGIAGLIADLSNTMKDSSKFQDELNNIIDMV